MSEESRIKEEIGWYKVAFAILMATCISLLAWLVENYAIAKPVILVLCWITIVVVIAIIVLINRKVFKKLDRLEEL
ncbi:hypothetical protein [Candidatus Thiodubiliella endoseptemdiera]|uniref:hypothetical protein n=1 Tax=Candidatus Thiodubiliella endoseptemdiera TaxID=2738886 RepID=UPI0034DE0CF2